MPPANSVAIDGLARLPLARSLDSTVVSLRKQTGVPPRQPARSHDAPDDRLRLIDQHFVINLNETLRRQYTAPVSTKSLIGAHIADERRPSGRKPHARVEMRLMDRQRCIQGTATTMDDRRARQRQVEQSNPLKVQRHLV